MPDPLVSVCTVTYNHEAFIRRAIEGVMGQRTDFPIEMVIGNDASSDGTGDVIEACVQQNPDKIIYLNHPDNIGMMENFMSVFSKCRGKYIALLDGDDEWTDMEKLARQVDALETNPQFAICFHDVMVVSDTDAFQPYHSNGTFRRESTIEDLVTRNFMQTCSVMYRAGPVTSFPDWFSELPAGDWPMHLMHARNGPILYLEDCMAKYRVHGGGIWSGVDNVQKLTQWIPMCRRLDEHLQFRYTHLFKKYEVECLLSIAAYSESIEAVSSHLGDAFRLAKEVSRFPIAACGIRFLRLLAGRLESALKKRIHA